MPDWAIILIVLAIGAGIITALCLLIPSDDNDDDFPRGGGSGYGGSTDLAIRTAIFGAC